MNITHAFPLEWPDGVARTDRPAQSRFMVPSIVKPLRQIETELQRFGADSCRITANCALSKQYRTFLATAVLKGDPGAAVYFSLDGAERVLACDRWSDLPSNLRAIGNTLAALRGMERWGCADVVARSLEGFKALPAPDPVAPARPWWEVLGVQETADPAVIEAAYRALAKRTHPDAGGDPAAFHRIHAAYEASREIAR